MRARASHFFTVAASLGPALKQSGEMLPSRLFRNTGCAPPLRSLITPHSSLPASLSVQLRLRLGVLQPLRLGLLRRPSSPYSSASAPPSQTQLSTPSPSTSSPNLLSSQTVDCDGADQSEPKLSLTFTCTAPSCDTRSTHQFTKRAYEKGIVLVQCPGCKNRCVF
jgi:protein import protein ZIM17